MRQEQLQSPSLRDKLTRTAFAASVAFSLNIPHETIDIICENSLSSSTIELQRAPDLGFSFNAQRIQKYIDDENLQMTAVEMLDGMLSLDPALQYIRIATPMNQPIDAMLAEFDRQMQVIKQHDRKAYPVIGLHQIHYPVIFPPEGSMLEDKTLNDSVLSYAKQLLPLLEDYDNEIAGIQLSNEPFNTFPFAPEVIPEDEALIASLHDLLKPLGKDLLVTFFVDEQLIDTEAFYKVLKYADIVGLDLYPEGASCSNYYALTEYYKELARKHNKRVIVAEMQTRKWDYEKRYTTFPIMNSYRGSLHIDPEMIMIWNLEVPYMMDKAFGNPEALDTIREFISANDQARAQKNSN